MIYSTALTAPLFEELRRHLVRDDGQEDLCFALWRPSTGRDRLTALIGAVVLPHVGERAVHGNASFAPAYLDRVIDLALDRRVGIAFLHSHPAAGWQGMSRDDVRTEESRAGQVLAATGLPLVGLTMGSDGPISARVWERIGPRRFARRWCENVRVVGAGLGVTPDRSGGSPPPAAASQIRTVSAWGAERQAILASLRVGIVGAGSVGALVGESLARMGLRSIRLIDFDSVEEHNLDRLLHARARDIGRAKVRVLGDALRVSATAPGASIQDLELSVCEEAGFAAALDCDVLFSCVDRPWPRKVLNVAAYAHLIPVIDGGVRVASPSGRLLRADWRVVTAAPGRICLDCAGQFDPADVALERAGLLDDPEYIRGLPEDHNLRVRQNVFAFSASLASLETLQLLSMVVAPHGVVDPGIQTFHFVTGSLDQEWRDCANGCRYSGMHLAAGDAVAAGTVPEQPSAQAARGARSRGAARDIQLGSLGHR